MQTAKQLQWSYDKLFDKVELLLHLVSKTKLSIVNIVRDWCFFPVIHKCPEVKLKVCSFANDINAALDYAEKVLDVDGFSFKYLRIGGNLGEADTIKLGKVAEDKRRKMTLLYVQQINATLKNLFNVSLLFYQ